MNTFGYDILVQASEKLLNKSLAAAFYTGMLKHSGTYSFVEGVPDRLKGFIQVDYRVRLRNEPCLDLVGPPSKDKVSGEVGIRLSLELCLRVLKAIDLEFDVDIGATAQVGFDLADSLLKYSLVKAEIYDLKINDRVQMHQNTLDQTNKIIAVVLKSYLQKDVRELKSPFDLSGMGVPLPQAEGATGIRLPLKSADFAVINQHTVAVGVNFFEAKGSLAGVPDLTGGAELFAAVDTGAMKKILDFWWARTQLKKFDVDGSMPVDIRANKVLAKASDIFARLVTLGLLQPETEIQSATLYYDAHVTLEGLPEISFESGKYAAIKELKLGLKLKARLEGRRHRKTSIDTSLFIPDRLTPWKDDIVLSEKDETKDIVRLEDDLTALVKNAKCQVTVDDQNRVAVKILEADLQLDLGDRWIENLSERVANGLLDLLEKNIIKRIPALAVSPSLLLKDLKVMGYSFDLTVRDVILEKEGAALRCDIGVNELVRKIAPMPLYVANIKSQRLHRADCLVVEEIDFTHRIGYHVVYDAVKDGFRPCRHCLPGYSAMNLNQ